jgi:hypothetical protein
MYSWQQAARSRQRECGEAQGSRLRAQGKNFVFYYLLPYALSKFEIRNPKFAMSSMPHAFFFTTDNGQLTADHRQVTNESKLG